MKCNHDINFLMGTADGVLCRKCGRLFPSFDALKAELEEDAPAPEAPAADPAEKPKRGRKKKEV